MSQYLVNEVFYSPQGEGVRAGTMNVFIRFAGCNLRCEMKAGPKSPGGFDCDTEFASGRPVTLLELALWCSEAIEIGGGPIAAPDERRDGFRAMQLWRKPWIILTGGEPGLQVDEQFITFWHERGVKLAIETNGSVLLPQRALFYGSGEEVDAIDWVTVSPKVAEHAIKQTTANEVKYVRGYGQPIPRTVVEADHYLISPAFEAGRLDKKTIDWCAKLVRENPRWRLSVQQHKQWNVR